MPHPAKDARHSPLYLDNRDEMVERFILICMAHGLKASDVIYSGLPYNKILFERTMRREPVTIDWISYRKACLLVEAAQRATRQASRRSARGSITAMAA